MIKSQKHGPDIQQVYYRLHQTGSPHYDKHLHQGVYQGKTIHD